MLAKMILNPKSVSGRRAAYAAFRSTYVSNILRN